MSVQWLHALLSMLADGDWRLVNVTVAARPPLLVLVREVRVIPESVVVEYPESKSDWVCVACCCASSALEYSV
jgi:hypothetical protein